VIGDVVSGLWAINCRFNFKVESDGRCHSTKCGMNVDSVLKYRIKTEGCLCFNDDRVQKELNRK